MEPVRLPRTIFDEEHVAFRSAVREFLAAEAVPRVGEWEAAGIIDREFWQAAAAQGFVGFQAPEEFGGLGIADFRYNAIIDEEVVAVRAGTDGFQLTNDIVGPYLIEMTTREQKERWLPGLVDGSLVPAIAMTEPGTGSDLRSIATTATREADGWRLAGAKTFITSGIQADLVIVVAQVVDPATTDTGLGLFVVERDAEGFSRGRALEKIGRKAQDTAELYFDDVFVPDADVLGVPGDAMRQMRGGLAQERLSMAVTGIAGVERALELTLQQVTTRTAFGTPIGSFQANRFALAELVGEARAVRVYVDDCIRRHVEGALGAAEAAGAKHIATELEWKTLDRCLQLHGGYGYMREYEIAQRWLDARVQRIYGGTSEIMLEIVGRSLGL